MSHLDYLFSLEQFGIKLGLTQIQTLLAALDHPERASRTIVVAGTNGKGSVTAMIERGLRAAGCHTGRYTSPHLIRLGERVAVDGVAIDDVALDRLAGQVRTAAQVLPSPPSFFEATTAVALLAFRDAKVDVAVLEVGLGGRLDATNVVTPMAVAITAIDFDHEAHLGHTLTAIAGEKAGVIKPGTCVVAGENPDEALAVIRQAAGAVAAPMLSAVEGVQTDVRTESGRLRMHLTTPHRTYDGLRAALRGRHQVQNIVTAVRLLEALDARGLVTVPEIAIRAAVEDVEWPGRLQMVSAGPHEILIDGAHNPAGARALAAYVLETYGRRLPFVVGMMADKNLDQMIASLAPAAARFVFTAPDNRRAAAPEALRARASIVAPAVTADAVAGSRAALDAATRSAGPVVVAGSLYLAGEILAQLS